MRDFAGSLRMDVVVFAFSHEDNIFAYIMDRKSSIDIDEEIDFLFVQRVIELI